MQLLLTLDAQELFQVIFGMQCTIQAGVGACLAAAPLVRTHLC